MPRRHLELRVDAFFDEQIATFAVEEGAVGRRNPESGIVPLQRLR